MTDLQLPRPLLSPSEWSRDDRILVSLDAVRYGGAFRDLIQTREVAFAVAGDFWQTPGHESFRALASEFPGKTIKLVSNERLSRDAVEAWRSFFKSDSQTQKDVEFEVDPKLTLPTLHDWSLEVYPLSAKTAGELHWTRLIKNFERDLGLQGRTGLEALRLFPAFSRQQKVPFLDELAREAAYADSLFSPQDDKRGAFGTDVIQNPTLQIVTTASSLVGFWRVDGHMNRADLTWEEAAVIDELRDQSRLPLRELQHALNEKRFPLKNHSTFHLVIEEMIRRGLLLLRP